MKNVGLRNDVGENRSLMTGYHSLPMDHSDTTACMRGNGIQFSDRLIF